MKTKFMEKAEETFNVKNCGITLELDREFGDSGVYIWNCDGFIDMETIDNLIKSLGKCKEMLLEKATLGDTNDE